jgi:hypothetical protein
MPIDINGVTVTGGTSVVASDGTNKLFQQTSAGIVIGPRTSTDNNTIAMFNVGYQNAEWIGFTAGQWNVIPFSYTAGNGYYNVNGCYNTSTYRFTAPVTGFYLFKFHAYIYFPDSGLNRYCHPGFTVNSDVARNGTGAHPYKIRQYGIPANYGQDTDMCDMFYLNAGDYIQAVMYVGNGIQVYAAFSSFNGSFLGS